MSAPCSSSAVDADAFIVRHRSREETLKDVDSMTRLKCEAAKIIDNCGSVLRASRALDCEGNPGNVVNCTIILAPFFVYLLKFGRISSSLRVNP